MIGSVSGKVRAVEVKGPGARSVRKEAPTWSTIFRWGRWGIVRSVGLLVSRRTRVGGVGRGLGYLKMTIIVVPVGWARKPSLVKGKRARNSATASRRICNDLRQV